MTYAPPTLTALARYWVSQGGVNLGVVGDAAHQAKGMSYHLGRSQLASDAYSRTTTRDRAGLSEAASAIDLGRLKGALGPLRAFSRWLVVQCQAGIPGTADIREVIYTIDGKVVMRYDRERGAASTPRPGEANLSHLTHTHVSFYRDSERRSKVGIFTPYFALLTAPVPPKPAPSSKEDDVIVVTIEKFPIPRSFASKGSKLRRFSASAELDPIEGAYKATVDATVAIESAGVPHGAGFLRINSGGSAGRYILASEVTLT